MTQIVVKEDLTKHFGGRLEERVVKHRNILPAEMVEFPFPEMLMSQLGKVMSNLL